MIFACLCPFTRSTSSYSKLHIDHIVKALILQTDQLCLQSGGADGGNVTHIQPQGLAAVDSVLNAATGNVAASTAGEVPA